jgi:pimeloyl-ACP methyl ester carboxylesterase
LERHEELNISFLSSKWPFDKGKPNLLFIHGAGVTALSWILQFKGLANKANVIALDLPGHGQSKGPGMNTVPDYAKTVADLINALKIHKCTAIGISMGGAIVQQLLIDYASLLCAGILINTGAKLKVLPAIFEAVKTDFKAFITGMSNILLPADTDAKKHDASLKDTLAIDQEVIIGDFIACDNFDIRERLHEISSPVLVISSKNDIITPVWYGEYLVKMINNAKFTIIKGAGHLAPLEKPKAVNAAIYKYIKSIQQL